MLTVPNHLSVHKSDDKKIVIITYTNYRGETSERGIIPKEIIFCKNEWHTTEQWMIVAYDLEKKAERTFAINDIKGWTHL